MPGRFDGTTPSACILPADGKLCSAPTCTEGVSTLPAVCDGNGACLLPDKEEYVPYACGVTGCRTGCASTADDCAKGFECIAGECTMVDTDAGTADAGTAIDATTAPTLDAAAAAAGDASVGPTGGNQADGGTASAAPSSSDEGSCGCRLPNRGTKRGASGFAFLMAVFLLRRRRSRRASALTRCGEAGSHLGSGIER